MGHKNVFKMGDLRIKENREDDLLVRVVNLQNQEDSWFSILYAH